MKRSVVFEVLDAPPGGLTRLRARMRADQSRRWLLLPVVGAAVAVLISVWPDPVQFDVPRAGPQGVEGRDGTEVMELQSSTPGVLRFVVMQTR